MNVKVKYKSDNEIYTNFNDVISITDTLHSYVILKNGSYGLAEIINKDTFYLEVTD
jgi:N12 class adenine-specific DNA methylase